MIPDALSRKTRWREREPHLRPLKGFLPTLKPCIPPFPGPPAPPIPPNPPKKEAMANSARQESYRNVSLSEKRPRREMRARGAVLRGREVVAVLYFEGNWGVLCAMLPILTRESVSGCESTSEAGRRPPCKPALLGSCSSKTSEARGDSERPREARRPEEKYRSGSVWPKRGGRGLCTLVLCLLARADRLKA